MRNLFKLFFVILFTITSSYAQLTLPYVFENNSRYNDDEIYIGLVGKFNPTGDVWMDMSSSTLQEMSADLNTVDGPEWSHPTDWKYPDIFTKLSDINNKTIQIPHGLYGCRIFIAFESPMFLRFHATGGYAGANLSSDSDPNDGIRWEIVELTWGNSGLWTNTSRVDAYQYPMALEVTGYSGGVDTSQYEDTYNNVINSGQQPELKRIGEVLAHEEILNAWDTSVSNDYLVSKIIKTHSIDNEPIIEQPSKVPSFPDDVLDAYIDDIWTTYASHDLVINIGDRGTWTGRVNSSGEFQFTDPADGSIATIYGKPSTFDAIEGAGFLAYTPVDASQDLERNNEDLMIQAQMTAAITRHAIYTNITNGTVQFTHDESRFFQITPYNEYVKFFHDENISLDSQTYAFAYDDVGDHSSTIQTTFPTNVKVIIGGFSGRDEVPGTDTDNLALFKPASQSSTAHNGIPERAVDGNTSGNWGDDSITHTSSGVGQWWKVDLGTTESIGDIILFNRTNCCMHRLNNVTVSVEDSNENVLWSEIISSSSATSLTVNAQGVNGRVIRVTQNQNEPLSLAEVEVYEFDGDTSSTFPDTSKKYHIDIPVHNLRLAATGESEDAYTTSTNNTGEDVEWQFVAKGNGYWHLQRAAGGTKPRLRTDNSEFADMQPTGWSGTYTYYELTAGFTEGTYFVTLPDGPANHKRLQVNNLGEVKMVSTASNRTWESFRFTEVSGNTSNNTDLFIEAEDYIAMSEVQTQPTEDEGGGLNVGWIDANDWMDYTINVPASGSYTLNLRVASPNSGASASIVINGSVEENVTIPVTGDWQIWETISTTINLSAGAQTLRILSTGNGWNINWLSLQSGTGARSEISTNAMLDEIRIYPNPVNDILQVSISNQKVTSIEIIDAIGKTHLKQGISSSNGINLSSLSKGLYFVRLSNANKVVKVTRILKK